MKILRKIVAEKGKYFVEAEYSKERLVHDIKNLNRNLVRS